MPNLHLVRRGCLFACLLGNVALFGQPLSTVRAVRSLSAAEAAKGHQVRLRGVVTTLSGWKDSFFLQDKVGISIDRHTTDPVLHAGQRVVVRGVTAAGSFAPLVEANEISVEGSGRLPVGPRKGPDDLADGRQDSQWIAITGKVRSAGVTSLWGHERFSLYVDIGSGTIVQVYIYEYDAAHLPQLTGASVRISGVCGTIFNNRRQFSGVRLFAPSFATLTILRPAPQDPYTLPIRPLDSLFRFSGATRSSDLTRVTGTVTWWKPGSAFYMQSGDEGLFVEWTGTEMLPIGAHADVVGYPFQGHGSVRLQAAFVRAAGSGALIVPRMTEAARVISNRDGFTITPAEGLLIETDGTLVDTVHGTNQTKLVLEEGHTLFTVRVPNGQTLSLTPGTVLRVRGICNVDYDDYTNQPTNFFVEARSLSDIKLLYAAPWWNAAHAIRVAELLATMVVILLGSLLLSRQKTLQVLATTDTLTGLVNRRCLLRRLDTARRSNRRTQQNLRLLFIDVDHFKEINDRYGHRRGDETLKQIACLLRDTFPEGKAIARIGGDEFVVILQQTSRIECQHKLQSALDRVNLESGQEPLSLSLGVVECGPNEDRLSGEELLHRADELMYKDKHATRSLSQSRGLQQRQLSST